MHHAYSYLAYPPSLYFPISDMAEPQATSQNAATSPASINSRGGRRGGVDPFAGTQRSRGNRGRRGRGRGGVRAPGNSYNGQDTVTDSPRGSPVPLPPGMSGREGGFGNRLIEDASATVGSGQIVTKETAVEDDLEAEVCFICASPVVHNSVAPCNHRTCHICALRLRALYKTKACAHCRVELSHHSRLSKI